jgi:YesN/AraC family two-component response regulator
VLVSTGADQALTTGEKHPGAIDLLLTDVVMPGKSGGVIAESLSRQRPEMRILYISGYTDDAIVHHGVLSAGASFVQKPFTADALTRKIREILDPN